MEQIPTIFWTCILVWIFSETTILVRLALFMESGKNLQDLQNDETLKFHWAVSKIAKYLAAGIGFLIIIVSLGNLIKGGWV